MHQYIIVFYLFIIVNYEDVSDIIIYYLRLWSNVKTEDYLYAKSIIEHLNLYHNKLCLKYFSYCDYKVTHDDFLQFVILFSFFSIDQITKVLLCVSGNQSNLYVTYVFILLCRKIYIYF